MSHMRVACLGNMNNNMFCLVRYLRDRGYDAHLLMLSHEQEHFLPEADTYSQNYSTFVRRLQWGSDPDFAKTTAKTIRKDLDGFDAIIACNYAPAFLQKAGIELTVFCPHGSDYYEVAFQKDHHNELTPLAQAQRTSIQEARFIMAPKTNPDREWYWHTLQPKGERVNHPTPLLYLPEYTPERIARFWSPGLAYETLSKIKKEHDLLLFQHARQCWTPPRPYQCPQR